jgi:hypothetical protein
MYLINSSLRTGENLLVETINTTISNTGNLSCDNTLLSDKNVMTHIFDNFLSNITGELFTTSLSSSNIMTINSQTCNFKLDISSNIDTFYPYNLLGFNSSALPNTFYNTITGLNNINLNTPIFQTNIFQLDVLKTSSDQTFQIYQPNFVIQNLCQLIQDQLIINTNLSWQVVYDSVSDRVKITLISTNNFSLPVSGSLTSIIPEYKFKFIWNDSQMIHITNALGFTEQSEFVTGNITAENPPLIDTILSYNDIIVLNIEKTDSSNIKSYQIYEIPLNLPIYNPKECIDQISKKLSDTTAKPWSISSNIGETINNNSYLQMNLYDTDTSFRMLWANVSTGNISKSMGFANIDTPNFENTIISGNIIDFNYNLNYTDQLNYEIKSNIYYKLDDFIIPTNSNERVLNEYIVSLSRELQNISGKKYSVYFQESTQKIYISVSDTNTTFKILFGHPSMTNIAQMLGFNPVNTPTYVNYLVSDYIVDYSIQLSIEDIFYMIQQSNNYDFSTFNTISINQSYFLSNTFINNLQDILTTKTNKSWSVSQTSNYLTIQVNSPNCAFQFLWGDASMKNVSTALGFDTINPTTFLTTTTSNNNINTLIQFNDNDQLVFKFRDTTQTYSIPKSYLYDVPNEFYSSQKFIKSLALILYNLTNKIFEVSYDTNTQKITIQIDSSNSYFKIQWQLPSMLQIGQMLGFNDTETSDYTTTTTGQNVANLSIELNDSSVFSISIVDKTNINYDSFINKYMLSIDPNFFYPDYFFQYMANLINKDLVYPLIFFYNSSTRKLTISSTNKFQIDFGNMTNLAKVLGFNFTVSPTYELSFTGVNQIDMTVRVLPTDLFRVHFLQSITKFQVNFYDFYAEYHSKLLENYLYLYTGLLWKSDYNSATKKISITLNTTKYKFILTDPKMNTIATIFGFSTTTLPPFEYTQTSDFSLSFSTYSGNTLVVLPEQYDPNNAVVIYSFEPNYNIPKKYALYIEPIIYTPALLVSYLQTKLNTEIPGIGFIVNYDSITNKITISNSSPNIKFRFLFGKSILLSKLMGFNNSDISIYENTITSEKEIIMSGQFGKIIINPNAIISFNKITLKNIQLPILENITDFNNTLTIENTSIKNVKLVSGYYTDITIPLQTALNTSGIGNFTVSLLNNKLTINCDTPFKILWSKNTVLAVICGFNPTDMTNLITSVSSDFLIDLVYPKNIYLDLDGIKYQSNFFNNKHMFLINLNVNINLNDIPTINAPNNSVNKLIFSLYDENNYLISPTKNWNATVEFS